MKKHILYLDNKEKLCLECRPICYDLERGAKIDLCLEIVHEFLKRRKGTTQRLEVFLKSKSEKIKQQLFKKHELLYLKEPSSLLDGINNFYDGIDKFLFTFSEVVFIQSLIIPIPLFFYTFVTFFFFQSFFYRFFIFSFFPSFD